jgi:hypothetical protein
MSKGKGLETDTRSTNTNSLVDIRQHWTTQKHHR